MHRRFRAIVTVGAVMSVLLPAGAAAAPSGQGEWTSVQLLLDQLRVEDLSTTGYSASLFSVDQDLDGDGCRTREEVLQEESEVTPVVIAPCTVASGQWNSDYDNILHIDPAALEVDHLIALPEAWRSGAWAWSDAQRTAFANDVDDPRTLTAVTAALVAAKDGRDPATWMPPTPFSFMRCTYIAEWVAVKWRWNLSVDPAEKSSIQAQIRGCGSVFDTATPAEPRAGRPADPPLPEPVDVFRFWSARYGSHFFTTSASERDQIRTRWPDIWTYEGTRFTAFSTQVAGTVPLYRFWSDAYASHFYTASQAEKDAVPATWPGVWRYEGVAYYVYPADSDAPDTKPVTRFWSTTTGHHFYTADADERDGVMSRWWRVWLFEGDGFRVPSSR